jgi:SPP1 gp7 family putative phage head morphogenesis protein
VDRRQYAASSGSRRMMRAPTGDSSIRNWGKAPPQDMPRRLATLSTADDKPKASKPRPTRTGRAERQFMAQLRDVARHVGRLINGFEPGTAQTAASLQTLLRAYGQALKPWAVSACSRMLGEVDARDRDFWRDLSANISSQLKHDILRTPVGPALRGLLNEQVGLIQSLPIEAAERVHSLTVRGLLDSTRANEIAAEIKRTGEVTDSRAQLIARTEVARTASILTETRARAAGALFYVWETSRDADVRPGHRAMQGQICRWDDPPAVNENGRIMYHHPGRFPNCRCWASPLITDTAF